jgi:sec-independent protein translocase protein TatA
MFPEGIFSRGLLGLGPLGFPELIIILVIVLLLFGARRLPEIGAGLGRSIQNFKDAMSAGKKEDESPKNTDEKK